MISMIWKLGVYRHAMLSCFYVSLWWIHVHYKFSYLHYAYYRHVISRNWRLPRPTYLKVKFLISRRLVLPRIALWIMQEATSDLICDHQSCGRSFSSVAALNFHKRCCQPSKKRLQSALPKAKELWEARKKARLMAMTRMVRHSTPVTIMSHAVDF
jgi:hypothetical protein